MAAESLRRLRRAARIILIGAPGVGKGTQAERLMQRFPHISTISSGDLLRCAVRDQTAIGLKAASHMSSGSLVPDDLILNLILTKLKGRSWIPQAAEITDPHPATFSDDPTASFILDGFPRTASQAKRLDALLPINFVVSITTPADIILGRIADRWIHAGSGRTYNNSFNRPRVPGRDDVTDEPLAKRADDTEQVWKKRLRTFDETSEPLLQHYEKLGCLWRVNGNSSDEITPRLFAEMERRFC